MEPSPNPDLTPKELDALSRKLIDHWTLEDQEKFFASQDAVTGLFPNSVANNVLMPNFIQEIEHIFDPGIHITSIVAPEQGWPIAAHCEICKKTVIVLSPWVIKPEQGDYWKLEGTCLDDDEHIKHNMYPQKWYQWPTKPLPGGYVDATGPHRGVPPTEEDFQKAALMTMHRTMFAQGPIEFQVHDPLPPQDNMQAYLLKYHVFGPYDAEITQEMSIDEAKKRWQNTPEGE